MKKFPLTFSILSLIAFSLNSLPTAKATARSQEELTIYDEPVEFSVESLSQKKSTTSDVDLKDIDSLMAFIDKQLQAEEKNKLMALFEESQKRSSESESTHLPSLSSLNHRHYAVNSMVMERLPALFKAMDELHKDQLIFFSKKTNAKRPNSPSYLDWQKEGYEKFVQYIRAHYAKKHNTLGKHLNPGNFSLELTIDETENALTYEPHRNILAGLNKLCHDLNVIATRYNTKGPQLSFEHLRSRGKKIQRLFHFTQNYGPLLLTIYEDQLFSYEAHKSQKGLQDLTKEVLEETRKTLTFQENPFAKIYGKYTLDLEGHKESKLSVKRRTQSDPQMKKEKQSHALERKVKTLEREVKTLKKNTPTLERKNKKKPHSPTFERKKIEPVPPPTKRLKADGLMVNFAGENK